MPILDPSDFTGRVALIVGAHRGIGWACAEAFSAGGAELALADLPSTGLEARLDQLSGANHSAHVADVSDAASVAALMDEVVAAHGRIDILVNTAAVLAVAPVVEIEVEDWDRVFAINARGMFLTLQAGARQMIEQGSGGRIVAIASSLGHTVRLNKAAYSASKAAVIQLVRCLALELASHDINVNALCPGSTDTEMLGLADNPAQREATIRGDVKQWRVGIPLGRLAQPEDQAAMVAFLASDAARHMTGQAIFVEGGQGLA